MDYPAKSIRMIVSGNINRLLSESKKTRHQICDDLGIKYTTFCDWIKGNSSPKLESLEAMSSYFGVEIGDFFVDFDDPGDISKRLSSYAAHAMTLDVSILDSITDDQFRELINKGFSFRHKSLEEYIRESGRKLVASPEYAWGSPVGDELW